MQSGTHKRTGIATLCSVALLLTTAIPSYSGAITNSFQSIAEQAWMEQYIPRSYEETLPLTNYDNFEVTELFRAETIENLEASLTDGYPMPWLEEVLKDTTIPWEDRYWLDCRVRAVFAQDLHLFFDREDNPVHVEADWIRYGESYWQEHFIVNPPGEYSREETNPATGLWGETGFVYNRFGEQTGRLALCEDGMYLSRDGSVGLLVHRGTEHVTEYGPVCLYFVYSDGSYYKNPDELWTYDYTLSQSGEYALLVQRIQNGPDLIQMLDKSGNTVWEQEAAATTVGACLSISPDDSFSCVSSNGRNPVTHYLQVFDSRSGYEVMSYREQGVTSTFSQNGKLLCIGDDLCMSLNNLGDMHSIQIPDESLCASFLSCSNNADRYAAIVHPPGQFAREETYLAVWSEMSGFMIKEAYQQGENIRISSNGVIALTLPVNPYRWVSSIPYSIWLIGYNQ